MKSTEAMRVLAREGRGRSSYFYARAGIAPYGKTVPAETELLRKRCEREARAFAEAADAIEAVAGILEEAS